jgi:hypothetical protein
MLRGEFFSFLLALLAPRADLHDFRPHCGGRIQFDRGSISGHNDDSLGIECSRRVSHALCVVAARIRDDAALALLRSQRRDLVVSPAQLERADRLQILKLKKKSAGVARIGDLGRDIDGGRANGDSV